MSQLTYQHTGRCPICEKRSNFTAKEGWYRDHLFCHECEGGSKPRERALMFAIRTFFPDWQRLAIHESSPMERGASVVMKRLCVGYLGTQFFPGVAPGSIHKGIRCENLEQLTFDDGTFDLTISQDVMEHVNRPDRCFREVARTLKPAGAYIFTAPTYKSQVKSERRAIMHGDYIEHLHEPEYHGNPIDPQGSLVTFRYGYDLPEKIFAWSGLNTTVMRFHDHNIGVIGEFTEVYVCRKTT